MDDKFEIFKEMLELSRDEKRGLTIFIGGQTIAGVVTKIIETKAVEVKSQTYSRAVVFIDSIDAVALT